MSLWRFFLVLISVGALALPASAGSWFGKKTKPNPAERVPELIVIVKTDKDEGKRASAAEELRQYDPAAHPDIVPVLIDVLLNDAKPGVRVEAAESLGKLRPISQEAGWALEQAREKDSSMRVRAKARYELLGYYWAGYHSDPKLKEAVAANPKDAPPEKGKGMPTPSVPPPASGTAKGTPDKVIITPMSGKPKPMVMPPGRPSSGETSPPPLADPTPPAAGAAPRLLPALPTPPAKGDPSPLPEIPLPPDGGPSLPNPGGE
jgi:hypothetical protein